MKHLSVFLVLHNRSVRPTLLSARIYVGSSKKNTLKMEARWSFETSVIIYQSPLSHITKGLTVYQSSCQQLNFWGGKICLYFSWNERNENRLFKCS